MGDLELSIGVPSIVYRISTPLIVWNKVSGAFVSKMVEVFFSSGGLSFMGLLPSSLNPPMIWIDLNLADSALRSSAVSGVSQR